MSTIEMEIRKLRNEFGQKFKELQRIIVTHMVKDKWVQQDVACALMNIKPRTLRDIRIHLDKNEKKVGCIGWKKGKGRNVLYYLPDIEKYNGEHALMN